MTDKKQSETSDQRLWRNIRFLKAVVTGVLLGMGGGVEARPSSALQRSYDNTTGLFNQTEYNTTGLFNQTEYNNFSHLTAREFNPGKISQADYARLKALRVTDEDIENVQQGKDNGKTLSKQKESSKSKGKNPLLSNRKKVDVLRSLMVRAETDPRARQRLRRVLAESRQIERANRTMDHPPINDTVSEHVQKTEISPAEAKAMRAKALGRKQLQESTAPSPSSLTHVVGPTHECIVSDPSECLDITGTKVIAWAQPSSFGIPGDELLVDIDLQATNRCPDTVKDMTFEVGNRIGCPSDHPLEAHSYNSYASLTFTYPAKPTVIDVGATASAQNSTLVQCVHWAGGVYDSAALPDVFILDIRAQGSDTQFTVRSQDKYVAAVGPILDYCPQTPPPSSSDIPQTPPSPGSPDIPQTPPSPEAPATATPSTGHKGHHNSAVLGGVLGTILGTGALAVGCSIKIRREKHDLRKGQVEVTEIGGSVKVG